MTISLLTHTAKAGTSSSTVTTGAIDTTGATLIVLVVAQYFLSVGSNPPMLTDSAGNTWPYETFYTDSVNPALCLAYCNAPVTSTTHTFTNTEAYPSLAVAAFSGTALGAPPEFAVGSGAGGQPGSSAPNSNGALIVTGVTSNDNTHTYAVDSGFTITDGVAGVPAASVDVGLAYLVQTTAAAVNPTWSGQAGLRSAMTAFPPASSTTGNFFLFLRGA